MSEAVERRLVTLLDNPRQCPHGNPIPGLEELGADPDDSATPDIVPLSIVPLSAAATAAGRPVVVRRISEQLQSDADLMRTLKDAHVQPGERLSARSSATGVRVDGTELSRLIAEHVFVTVT